MRVYCELVVEKDWDEAVVVVIPIVEVNVVVVSSSEASESI